MHLWAAGYDLPPETVANMKKAHIAVLSEIVTQVATGAARKRGKKVARAKRQKAVKS